MSHFKVIIIGENIERQLSKYDENMLVPHIMTKQQHIDKKRSEIESYKNGLYARYLYDPEEYLKGCSNNGHIKYIQDEFPQKLKWGDEELYQDAIRYYKVEQINADGSTNETYNPHSKWDWYQVGGRWAGEIVLKDYKNTPHNKPNFSYGWDESSKEPLLNNTDQAFYKDIDLDKTDFTSYAVLINGKWYEKGTMGWWGMSINEDSEWESKQKELFSNLEENTLITVVDCHI